MEIKGSDTYFILQGNISSARTVAEGVPVTIKVAGTIGPVLAKDVASVNVGFKGAVNSPPTQGISIGSAFGGVILHMTDIRPQAFAVAIGDGKYLVGESATIEWPTGEAGDYYLTVIISFNQLLMTKVQEYPEYHVHVEPASAAKTAYYYQVGMAAAITSVVIAFVKGLPPLIIKSEKKSKKNKKRILKKKT